MSCIIRYVLSFMYQYRIGSNKEDCVGMRHYRLSCTYFFVLLFGGVVTNPSHSVAVLVVFACISLQIVTSVVCRCVGREEKKGYKIE